MPADPKTRHPRCAQKGSSTTSEGEITTASHRFHGRRVGCDVTATQKGKELGRAQKRLTAYLKTPSRNNGVGIVRVVGTWGSWRRGGSWGSSVCGGNSTNRANSTNPTNDTIAANAPAVRSTVVVRTTRAIRVARTDIRARVPASRGRGVWISRGRCSCPIRSSRATGHRFISAAAKTCFTMSAHPQRQTPIFNVATPLSAATPTFSTTRLLQRDMRHSCNDAATGMSHRRRMSAQRMSAAASRSRTLSRAPTPLRVCRRGACAKPVEIAGPRVEVSLR